MTIKEMRKEIIDETAGWPGGDCGTGYYIGKIGIKYVTIHSLWEGGKDIKMTIEDFWNRMQVAPTMTGGGLYIV